MDEPTNDNSGRSKFGLTCCCFDTTKDKLALLRWVNLVAFAANVVITYGVGVGGLFGLKPNTDVSDAYPTLVTPSGYAFAIWGLIFLFQGIWVLQQFILCPCFFRNDRELPSFTYQIVSVQWSYALVVLVQIVWTFCFGNEWIVASGVVMLILLASLAIICFLRLQRTDVSGDDWPWYAGLLTFVPFDIHFGWILVASIVNVNVALSTFVDSKGFMVYGGAVGGLAVLVLLTLVIIFRAGFFAVVPAVAVWGLVAVYLADDNRSDLADEYTATERSLVKYGALGSAIFIGVMALARGVWKLVATRCTRSRPQLGDVRI
jgi:translocator protein